MPKHKIVLGVSLVLADQAESLRSALACLAEKTGGKLFAERPSIIDTPLGTDLKKCREQIFTELNIDIKILPLEEKIQTERRQALNMGISGQEGKTGIIQSERMHEQSTVGQDRPDILAGYNITWKKPEIVEIQGRGKIFSFDRKPPEKENPGNK